MTLGSVNLLPAERRMRRVLRSAWRRWSVAVGLLAVVAVGPAATSAWAADDPANELRARSERAARTLRELEAEGPRLRAQLADMLRRDSVLDLMDDRPDWRPVLAAVAEAGGGARFERVDCELDRSGPTITIRMIGMVESMGQTRDLVLSFERLGVFDSVTLVGSSKVGLVNRDVVRFEIKAVTRVRTAP